MNNKNYYGVIMAGGVGSRFWPISTEETPKQFLDILNTGETLLQQTYRRLLDVIPQENILVVSNKNYNGKIKEQLPDILDENILLEPAKRNTAPCIAYSSFKIAMRNPNASIIVSPSDHHVSNEKQFSKNILSCLEQAEKNKTILMTLGIKPTRPDTGYGYIKYSEDNFIENTNIQKVEQFTEKPDLELAEKFLNSGDYLWNAGIFIWSVDSIITSFKFHLPEMYNIFNEGKDVYYTEIETSFIENNFPKCEDKSIDFGIMEKSDNVFVLPASFGWSDLGTWKSLYDLLPKNNQKNVIVNNKNVYLYNSNNNIIKKYGDKKIVLKGISNFIVVDTKDALLILPKDEEQSIKEILKHI